MDNCQNSIFGAFAPNSESAQALSKALGSQTVLTGSVNKGKDTSRSLQMIERPLMTPDELKSLPKGQFVVMKTGVHPMKTKLPLFLDWGIRFGKPYELPERAQRRVTYADKRELEREILKQYPPKDPESYAASEKVAGGMAHTSVQRRRPQQLDENGR